MAVAGRLVRQHEARALEPLGVARGDLAPPVRPFRDVTKLHAQDRGVEIVEAAVEPEAVDRPLGGAVVAQLPDGGLDIGAVRDDRAAVAERAQVLLNDEARAHGIRELTLLEARAVAVDPLRVVFDDPQVVLAWQRPRSPPCPRTARTGAPARCRPCARSRPPRSLRDRCCACADRSRRTRPWRPTNQIASAVAKNVFAVVMISSPGLTPSARNTSHSASVPELSPHHVLHAEVTGEIVLELLEGRARHVLAAFQHAAGWRRRFLFFMLWYCRTWP